MKHTLMECSWRRLTAALHRDAETGMFTATLTTPIADSEPLLLGAYGSNDAFLAFYAYVRFEQQALSGSRRPGSGSRSAARSDRADAVVAAH